MLTRAFNVVGLLFRVAQWKACLLAFAARRSLAAMVGYFIAAMMAFGGVALLLGAVYVALEAIVGVSVAMAAIGVLLLVIASLIWIIANVRCKGTGGEMTEHDVRSRAERDEEELRSLLGMGSSDPESTSDRSGPRSQSQPGSASTESLDDPRVVMAAGFALLSLLGPGRLFRTVRIATAVTSFAALANRALTDHLDEQGTRRAP